MNRRKELRGKGKGTLGRYLPALTDALHGMRMALPRTCEQAGGVEDVVGLESLRQLVPCLVALLQCSNAATAAVTSAAAASLSAAAAAGARQLGAAARGGCGAQRLAGPRGAQAGGQLAQAVVGLQGGS